MYQTQDAWPTVNQPPTLDSITVHVWKARTASHRPALASLEPVLDARERTAAQRFRFDRDRERYIIAHGIVRAVLARYLDRSAPELAFITGVNGKPALVLHPGEAPLEFNLSHSDDLILLAVARRPVGVDVERATPLPDLESIALRYFSTAERVELGGLPGKKKIWGFYAAWTRKEAYIKATGVGITEGLDHFDVSLSPDAPARLLADRRAQGAPARWSVFDLQPEDGYAAALVADRSCSRIERFTLEIAGAATSACGAAR